MDEASSENGEALSVAGRVLSKFVDAVADDSNLIEVAARLKPIMLDGGSITEAALREALFGQAAS